MLYTVMIGDKEFKTNSIKRLVNAIRKGNEPKTRTVIYK